MQEILLAGGNLNSVVQVGDTVRRSTGRWSAATHGLLRHLEAQGFEDAPRLLGLDEKGREILTFLPGEAGFMPYIYSEEVLVEAARLLRRFHDATVGYSAPSEASWQLVYPNSQRHEVICHNDFAPYNIIFSDHKPKALIDFDLCGPGPRVWDIAFATYWFVPLSFSSDLQELSLADSTNGSQRLRLFCDSYGLESTEGLLDTIEERLQFLCTWLAEHAASGVAAYQKMVDEGHLTHYQRELSALREQRPVLEKNLLKP